MLDTVISNMGPVHGVVARRDGLTTDDLKGTGWTMGIGVSNSMCYITRC